MNLRRSSIFLAAILVTILVVFSIRLALPPDAITAKSPKSLVAPQPAVISKDLILRETTPVVTDQPATPVDIPPTKKSVSQKLAQNAPALIAFKKWAEAYAVTPPENREKFSAEGLILAEARGEAMATLIRQDPQAAIQQLLPYSLRKLLPPEISARIEHRVSGVGDLMVVGVTPLPGSIVDEPIYRTANVRGENYRAYVYGSRGSDISRQKTRILGVGVKLLAGAAFVAVREDAYEVLDPAEAADLDTNRDEENLTKPESSNGCTGGETAVDTGDQILRLCCGDHFTQWLDTPEGKIVAADGGGRGTGGNTRAVPPSYTLGHKKLLVMRVRFADQPVGFEPATDAKLQTELQTVVNTLPKWSYGKMTADFAFTPTFDLPGTEASYEAGDMALINITRTIAAAYTDASGGHPYNPANFDFDAVVFKAKWGIYGGVGYVGANGTMVKTVTAAVFLHEWGHNFGLVHASYWEPKTDSPIGKGINIEYGNNYSTMGLSSQLDSFTTRERRQLSWLEDNQSPLIKTSGKYRIYNSDSPLLTSGRNYALKLQKYCYNYNVEYRPNSSPTQNPSWTTNGAMVLWDRDWELLDMTPCTSLGYKDAPLQIGRSYHDPEQQLTLTSLGRGGVSPEDYLDVVVNFNPSETNSPPVAVMTADNHFPAVNTAVNLSAIAADPDGDTLAYSWDFGDGSDLSTNNSATQTKSWAVAGDYPVRCTVSDMKGKISIQNLLIRVGSPATFSISGRATQADGTPIQNVMIKISSNRITYTNADGQYSLGTLASGDYVISAFCDGRTVTSQTHNNINIGPSATGVNFTMSTQPAGGITLDQWSSMSGHTVADLINNPAFLAMPNNSIVLTNLFETMFNQGNEYGQRARGYFLPPVSGAYTFYIAADDHAQLSLSTNDQAVNKRVVASITGDSLSRQWDKYPSQKSVAITLAAGQRYYIEALHKEGGFADHLAVAVDFPDGTQHRPLEAGYLQPMASSITLPPTPVNTVTVAATDAFAREGNGDDGLFTVTRTGSTTSAVTVWYSFAGTSLYSKDYQPPGLSITIPAGATSATVRVTTIDDILPESQETVILRLSPAVTYTLGAVVQDTVIVQDNETPQVSVLALRQAVSENGDEVGAFTFTRTHNLSAALLVNLVITGTATNGTDYTNLASTITIPAGEQSTTVKITGIVDSLTEPEETVTVSLSPGAGYDAGVPATATCFILAQPPTINWKAAVNGSWSDKAKWLTNFPVLGGSASYALNFDVTGNSYSTQNDLHSKYRLNQLNFSRATVTLTGESLAFVMNHDVTPALNQNSGNTASISNDIILNSAFTLGGSGNGKVILNGIISGNGSITKTSSGELSLSGMNSYTGRTHISRGYVSIGTPQRSALGLGMITLENGATLSLNRNVMPNELILKSSVLGSYNGWGDQWLGHITLEGACTIDLANTGVCTIEGNISGSGGFKKTGVSDRALTLSGISSYQGPTTVAAGILACSRPESLAQGTLRIDSGAILQLNFSGTRHVSALKLNSDVLQTNGVYGSSTSGAAFQNNNYFSGNGTITVGPLPATPYANWAAAQGLTSGVNVTPMADPDGDALCNLLEFTLGSNAMQTSVTALPQLKLSSPEKAVFEFDRSDAALSSITTVVEYGNDLNGWTIIQIPRTSLDPVTVTDGPIKDRISVTIPLNGDRIFARLRVSQ